MTSSIPCDYRLQEAFENRVLRGLSCEWEAALWVLPPPYRNRMKRPLIVIRDMKSRWGYWAGDKREIGLSRDLIFHHSWKDIRKVLHHEIAHQLADQVLGEHHNEPPHGTVFKKACYLLRIDPDTDCDSKPGQIRFKNEKKELEPTMIRRIKKLLALAGSQNTNEAEAAMAKAHELIAKYNIDMLNTKSPNRFISEIVGRPALRHSRDVYCLANLLQDFYCVDGIWVSAFVLEKGKMGRVLEISGTFHNVEVAGYVYDYVQHYGRCQWQEYNRQKKLNHYRKTDFLVGIVEGFREQLESGYERWAREKKSALIKVKDSRLQEYTAYKYPHITRFKRKSTRQDAGIIKDGIHAGRKMVLHKAITEKGEFKSKLIEH